MTSLTPLRLLAQQLCVLYVLDMLKLYTVERRLGENRNIMKQYETSDFEVR